MGFEILEWFGESEIIGGPAPGCLFSENMLMKSLKGQYFKKSALSKQNTEIFASFLSFLQILICHKKSIESFFWSFYKYFPAAQKLSCGLIW